MRTRFFTNLWRGKDLGLHAPVEHLRGALVLALVAAVFVMALRQGLPEADVRSLGFAALVATNLGLVLVNRSLARLLLPR